MRVSIALCTYNGEEFLREQLDSLLAQTHLPDEVIIRDDGSIDGSVSLLAEFSERAGSLGINVDLAQNEKNLGFAANFSEALRHCSGDIVFLCDQDDVWSPEKIGRMLLQFAARPTLTLLHTDAAMIDGRGDDLGYSLFDALEISRCEIDKEHSGNAFDVLLRRNTVTGATAAMRTHNVKDALPVPKGWIHDEWLALHCSLSGQVDCLEWKGIAYRQHANNQIGARKRTLIEVSSPAHGKRSFMLNIAGRLERFLDRADDAGLLILAPKRQELEGRAAHAAFRGRLPARLLTRLGAVFGEARTGRYKRYSSGLRSIVSDIVKSD